MGRCLGAVQARGSNSFFRQSVGRCLDEANNGARIYLSMITGIRDARGRAERAGLHKAGEPSGLRQNNFTLSG